jgi:hypothetical protein
MLTFVDISLKSVLQKAVCLICLGLSCWHPGFSQDGPQDFRESLYLQTDRDLYVVGEQVWMKVYKLDAHGNTPYNFSKVVYIELLNQAGYPVNQLKLHVPDKSGSSGLTLSDTLSSGNYLLRAYTSWMRNYPESDFSFRTISVINPFRDMERIGVRSSISVGEGTDTCRAVQTDKGLLLEVTSDSSTYGTRERVKVNILATDSSGNPVEADLSVSISISCLYNDHRANIQDLVHSLRNKEHGVPAHHMPELEGVVLRGTMLNSNNDEPLTNEDLMLSIVGKAARCQVYRTTDKGKFYFNLDDSGVQEIVIQPADSAVSDYYVELEPDFHNAYDHPLPGPFYLDTTRLQALNQGIINMQIENIYKPYRQGYAAGTPDAPEMAFYGEPEYHIQVSDYILLKNIREVIKEIVPKVSVRVKDGISSLWVDNGVDDLYFDDQPLLLIDGIPFDDVDQVLNISIMELERIEVINLRYFLDGHIFEGIIHFVTKEGKMAGLEFDHAIFRQAYAAFSEESFFRSPVYSSDSEKNSPLADFRNSLYWNPDLFTREDGKTSFEFYTSDETGDYTVIVEGISPDGKSGFIYKKLHVQ